MKKLCLVYGLAFAVFLMGCGQGNIRSRGDVTTVGSARVVFDSRLFVGECLFPKPEVEAPFLAAILPGLIDQGVSTLGAMLKAAGKAKSYPLTLQVPLDITTEEAIPQCLQVVRGKFFLELEDLPESGKEAPWIPKNLLPESYKAKMLNAGIWLAEKPDLFLEMPIYRAADGTAAFVAVRYLAYHARLATGAFRSPVGGQSIVVGVSLVAASKAPKMVTSDGVTTFQRNSDIQSAVVDLGRIRPGHEVYYYAPNELRDLASVSQPSRDATDSPTNGSLSAADIAGEGNSLSVLSSRGTLPIASNWVAFGAGTGSTKTGPMTLRVDLISTRDANQFLTLLGETVSDEGTKDAIAHELKRAIVPGFAAGEEQTAAAAQGAAVTSFYTAYKTAQTAVAAYEEMPNANTDTQDLNLLEKAIDARSGQENANFKALVAGLDPPFALNQLVQPDRHR